MNEQTCDTSPCVFRRTLSVWVLLGLFFGTYLAQTALATRVHGIEPFESAWFETFTVNHENAFTLSYHYLFALFSHADPVHLATNAAALLFFGVALAYFYGHATLLISFLAGGMFSAFNIVGHTHLSGAETFSVLGASGGIYAVVTFAVLTAVFATDSRIVSAVLLTALALSLATEIVAGMGLVTISHLSGFVIGLVGFLVFRLLDISPLLPPLDPFAAGRRTREES